MRLTSFSYLASVGVLAASALVGCSSDASNPEPAGRSGGASGFAGAAGMSTGGGSPAEAGSGTGGNGTSGSAAAGGGEPSAGSSPVGGAAGGGASGSGAAGDAGSGGAGGSEGGVGGQGGGGSSLGGGGAAGAGGGVGGGGAGGGASGAGPAPDCNAVTGQKVVTVGPSGADFSTVQAALNSLPKTNTLPTQIRIAPGTYKEKLSIQIPNITLCGQKGKASSTVLTYGDSATTSNGNGGMLGTTGSASTTLSSNDVSAENITFANSAPLGSMQAVALLVNGDRVQFRSCRFLSFQDTLYVRKARQYFRDCYVEGTVDYIFGDATAVFESCTAHNVSGGTAVTAPNTDQAVAHGLVFLGGQLTAASNVQAGSMALGRNWGPYGAATFLRTSLGPHISAVGWVKMMENTLETARFSEYKTTGQGARPASRAPQSRQLTDQQAATYSLSNVLRGWIPSYSE